MAEQTTATDPGIDHARQRAIDALTFARQVTLELLDDFPDDAMTRQAHEGDPHALWMLGHLAVSDEWIRGMIGRRGAPENPLPDEYNSLFGHGSTPMPRTDAYPDPATVRQHCEAARERLLADLRQADGKTLTRSLMQQESHGFASDPLDAANKEAWHEGWHAGQLSRIRRILGLPMIFPG